MGTPNLIDLIACSQRNLMFISFLYPHHSVELLTTPWKLSTTMSLDSTSLRQHTVTSLKPQPLHPKSHPAMLPGYHSHPWSPIKGPLKTWSLPFSTEFPIPTDWRWISTPLLPWLEPTTARSNGHRGISGQQDPRSAVGSSNLQA